MHEAECCADLLPVLVPLVGVLACSVLLYLGMLDALSEGQARATAGQKDQG